MPFFSFRISDRVSRETGFESGRDRFDAEKSLNTLGDSVQFSWCEYQSRDEWFLTEFNVRFPQLESGHPCSLSFDGLSPRSVLAAACISALLYWRARHGAIRTKHAAVPLLGTQERSASSAIVEKLTCVGRHRFCPADVAVRTGDRRFDDHMGNDIIIHVESVFSGLSRRWGVPDRRAVSCGDVEKLARDHLVAVREKISDLRRMERMLSKTLKSCSGNDVPDCPLIDTLFGTS